MLRIQRALLLELLVVFALVAILVTAVVFLGVTLRFLRDGGGALGGEALMDLLPHMVPLSLVYSVPLAWLAACGLVFGRLSSDHELVALTTAGVHLRTLAAPALAAGVLLAVAGMVFNGWQVPLEARELRVRLGDYLPRFLTSLRGTERSVAFDNGRLSFERWDEASHRLVGVELDRRDGDGRLIEKVTTARLGLERIRESSSEEGLRLDIQDAYVMRTPQGDPEVSWEGAKGVVVGHVQRVGGSMLWNEFLGGVTYNMRPRDLTVGELFYSDATGGILRGRPRDVQIALHGRLAMGSAAFFMGLFAMAVALALPASSHRVRDFTLCVAPAVLTFFPLQIAGPTLARSTGLPPWLAMWAPSLLLAAAAVLLLARAFRR